LTWCRSASRCTSCITVDRLYAPLPMTSWCHTPLSIEEKISWRCHELLSKFLGRFFRLRISPRLNDDVMLVRVAVDPDGSAREVVETHSRTSSTLLQALFFDLMAFKADQLCSTSVPRTAQAKRLPLFIVIEGPNLGEEFLAIVAEKVVADIRTSSGKEWREKS
jgi:hypothetical protein